MSDTVLQEGLEKASISDTSPVADGASPVATLITVEEWQEACTNATTDQATLVLQLGSDWCERCPAMHQCIKALKTDFNFKWVYSDAADTELTEHFEISKLPAVVVYKEEMSEPWVRQAVSVVEVQQAVKLMCPGVFALDADF